MSRMAAVPAWARSLDPEPSVRCSRSASRSYSSSPLDREDGTADRRSIPDCPLRMAGSSQSRFPAPEGRIDVPVYGDSAVPNPPPCRRSSPLAMLRTVSSFHLDIGCKPMIPATSLSDPPKWIKRWHAPIAVAGTSTGHADFKPLENARQPEAGFSCCSSHPAAHRAVVRAGRSRA